MSMMFRQFVAALVAACLAWAPAVEAVNKSPGGAPGLTNAGAVSITGGSIAGVTGVPTIVASGRATAQTAAKASLISYTVGASDASFRLSGTVLVTVATSHSFVVSVTYTDEGNVSRTANIQFMGGSGGGSTTTIANTGGAITYLGLAMQFRAKAGTTITVQTTGTFTTVTYNVEGWLELLQ